MFNFQAGLWEDGKVLEQRKQVGQFQRDSCEPGKLGQQWEDPEVLGAAGCGDGCLSQSVFPCIRSTAQDSGIPAQPGWEVPRPEAVFPLCPAGWKPQTKIELS